MNIEYGCQINVDQIKGEQINLFIIGGNHEKRVLTFYEHVKNLAKISKCVLLRHKDHFTLSPEIFDHRTISTHDDIYDLLNEYLNTEIEGTFTILVDYSCMAKSWYYSIILFLVNKNINKNNIRVIFSYTPSKFSEPLPPKPNSDIAPLPGKYVIPTDKPKALIICLGYEKSKAEGIIENLDPKICYIYYTKPTLDPLFSLKVEENNSTLIKEREQHVITYPFDDLLALERSLNSLYQKLKFEYSIIIAPLGPKPFAIISMIMAAKFDDIDIWRVGSGFDTNEYDREPLSHDKFIINDLFFTQKID